MYFKLWAAVARHTYSTWDIDLDVVQAGILNITRGIRFWLNCCGRYVNDMSTVDVKKFQNVLWSRFLKTIQNVNMVSARINCAL